MKEETIKGWVARDRIKGETSNLYIGQNKPRRIGEEPFGMWVDFGEFMALPHEMFHDLKWEDEPIEVEIVIRKKEEEQ